MKNNQETAFFIQARLGSTRLPGKMTLPFYNSLSIFDLLLSKLKGNFSNPIFLLTSTNSKDDLLEDKASENGIITFRGDENNVLKRFTDAAETYGIKKIIRICADNPFLDVAELKKLLEFVKNNSDFDYVSFSIDGTPSIKTHFGFWTEYISLQTLKDIQSRTTDKFYQEHVTNFIYEYSELYRIHLLEPNKHILGRNDIRMTLDTQQDFDILSKIYKELCDNNIASWGIKEIVRFLDSKPYYKEKMKEQITGNKK